ncbi:MAG TPA: hypothetical protein VGR78_07250 [Verrucomicrobiae bacterium]|jgi:hypothetical protein|nr:hypothetical protein [Verrucomicrobiae bacterium]
MLERLNPILRLICWVLAAVIIYQAARLVLPRRNVLVDFSFGNVALASTEPASTNKDNAVPPEVVATMDKIKDSQILGMIMRPPPMALIGIGGNDVMLRGPNGQTGLLREGEELGGVKLLRIGTNRILIEHEGQTKELTLFQGFGSESLLPKPTNSNSKEKTK